MIERVKIKSSMGGGNYFSSPKDDIDFIPSGSKLLDMALGGGWAEDRISNIVGDKSTGKTLICIEATSNFNRKYPKGKIYYREAEAAFDQRYAQALGMPVKQVDFGDDPLETVEDMFDDISDILKREKQNHSLYIIDSLDALSDRAEMDSEISTPTFGAEKAKKMSRLFRQLTKAMANAHMTMLVVSQIRDKIGVFMGKKTSRSGGKALDFYASQIVDLAQIGRILRTVHNIKRPVGIEIKAQVSKNKITIPFREAQFQIIFGYGIDDLYACLVWLNECGFIADAKVPKEYRTKLKAYSRHISEDLSEADYEAEHDLIHAAVTKRWYEVENTFLPKRRKYG